MHLGASMCSNEVCVCVCACPRVDEELLGDGHSYTPKALHSWLTRVMYNRRSKMNPLWNTVVIGGFYKGERWAPWQRNHPRQPSPPPR